jgi:transposase
VKQLAQRHEIIRQQIYAWRHDLKKRLWSPDAGVHFLPVDNPFVAGVPVSQLPVADAPFRTTIESRVQGGRSSQFESTMDLAALTSLIRAIEAA